MIPFLTQARQTVCPDRHGTHGPLPALLLALTLVTGLPRAMPTRWVVVAGTSHEGDDYYGGPP